MALGQLGVAYSLKKGIEPIVDAHIGDIEVLVHYDGIKLPENESFVYIKPRTNLYRTLSKGKETVLTDYNFDISIHATTMAIRSKMQTTISDLLTFSEFDAYTDDGELTKETLTADITSEVPLYPEEPSSDTKLNRLYFGVEISINKNKNGRKLT